MAETATQEIEEIDTSNIGVLFSPEGVIMLLMAALIDFLDFITGSFFVVDIFAILFIGGWMLFRSGSMKVTKRAGARIAKVAKWAKRLRWLRPLLIFLEFIPIIGVLPLWTLVVYFELRYS